MINRKYKFIFIHINRTGGTSWERSFNIKSGHDHRPASKIKKQYPKIWDEYFKFAIVRNPWDRYLSIARNRNIKSSKAFGKWINRIYRAKKPGLSVTRQLDWITDKDGKILVDYVARFENYKQEWYKICDIVNAKKKMRHINGTKHKHYSYYYTDETMNMVEEMAKKDIETFGYKFERAK